MTVERGRITRVVQGGRKAFVEVPKLGLGVEYGPCDVAWAPEFTEPSDNGETGSATTHDHPDGTAGDGTTGNATAEHRHQMPPLEAGMKVIVSTVHDSPDDVVVLGIIR